MANLGTRVLPRQEAHHVQRRRNTVSKYSTVTLFLLPGFLLLLAFLISPVFQSGYYSLFKWNGLGALDDFIGLANYQRALTHEVFQGAVLHSLYIMALSLVIQLPLAMTLAIILVRGQLRFTRLFRALFFIPFVFSEVIAAIIWLYVYHPNGGLVNAFLTSVIPGFESQAWLADRNTALTAIFFVLTWKFFGFHMLLYMAGLQNVSQDVESAARIDGAGEWKVLRHVTFPMMGNTIRLTVFLSILGSFQQFIIVWVLTEGGPTYATELIVTYLYKFGIQRMQLGYGSAIAVLLFTMTLIFSLGYQRLIMRQDYAE